METDYVKWKKSVGKSPEEFSFRWKYCENGSLGTRDIVARAIDSELKKSGDKNALLVTEHLDREELVEEFPNIEKKLSTFGINLGIDPIPVIPAAHYMVGGIDVDHSGRVRLGNSVIRGLYAIGEVARTGLHGANRLASNSLLEAVVYSERAAKDLIEKASNNQLQDLPLNLPLWRAENLEELVEHAPLRTDLHTLRTTMTMDVGIVKNSNRLRRAKRRVEHLEGEVTRVWEKCKPTQDLVELRNLIQVAKLVVDASIDRKENIGLHYNLDLEN